MEQGKTTAELNIGDRVSLTRQITDSDVMQFAEVTRDRNPIHVDQEYAKNTIFKGRIAHGLLTASLISAALATELPGPGNIYLSQSLHFTAPVMIGDVIRTEIEVIEKIPEKNRVRLQTRCYNQHGVMVIDGEAVVIPRK